VLSTAFRNLEVPMRSALRHLSRSLVLVLLIALIATIPSVAQSRTPEEIGALDKQAFSLYQQVMSPFCPGRALSDCPSSKAHDLKAEIRAKLEAGVEPSRILEDIFARFGEQYRAVPGYSGFALLAWIGPIVFLVIGLLFALRFANAGRAASAAVDSGTRHEIAENLRQEVEEELSRDR